MMLTIKFLIAAFISYVLRSNAQLQLNQRWKDRNGGVIIVPYTTTSKSGRKTDDARIDAAAKKLGEQARLIRFAQRTNQKAYIEVITDADGCNSDVGRSKTGTMQSVNLNSGCMSERSIQQGFLYALGMFPEQNRKDRDQFVRINLQNVPGKIIHNFDKIDDLETSVLETPYDYESLTHYTNVSVITTTNGAPLVENDELSPIDILELQLMYQCISGPRSLSSFNSNPCTSDCKCWEGAVGCEAGDDDEDDNDDACIGDLRCVNNECVRTEESVGCTDVPNNWVDSLDNSCQDYETNGWCAAFGNLFPKDDKTANEACCACGGGSNNGTGSNVGPVFINLKNEASPNLCISVRDGPTTDGAAVIHSQCTGGSNQKWYWDANNYIRSALDINKCIVGTRGLSDQGTNLVINTCFANDDRFKWVSSSDQSIRPLNSNRQCVVPSFNEQLIAGVFLMELFDCVDPTPNQQQWTAYPTTRRERVLQTENCADDPPGWYNIFGDNCEWYSKGTNCEDYGSELSNFGKTANQACCVCGGGDAAKASNVTDSAAVDNTNKCWDSINNWVDSVGDGCFWYSQGNNCQDFGGDFRSAGRITANKTAKEVCCACGGGLPTPPDSLNEGSPGCSNSPSRWVDDNNDGCDFYAISDNCEKFGDQFRGLNNKTANEACCACGGGSSNSSPTKSPCGLFNLSIFCPFSFCGIFGRLFRLCNN